MDDTAIWVAISQILDDISLIDLVLRNIRKTLSASLVATTLVPLSPDWNP